MAGRSDPNVGRAFVAWAKIGFYESASLVALSVAFWLAALPLVTVGAALLALLDVVGDVYYGAAPSGERGRLRRFAQSLRTNLVRGLPLSFALVFVFVNTYVYFVIGLFGADLQFVVGGIVGLYLCVLGTVFLLRAANVVAATGSGLLAAVRSAWRSWTDALDYTTLQIVLTTVVVLVSFALLPAVVLLLPGVLALLEVVFHDEATGEGPRTVLARYAVDA